MKEKDVEDLIDILYPYFYKKQKQEDKNSARLVDATVVSIGGPGAEIKINPYDTNTIYATVELPNEYSLVSTTTNNTTTYTLKKKSLEEMLLPNKSVKVLYSESLKNAQIIAINE